MVFLYNIKISLVKFTAHSSSLSDMYKKIIAASICISSFVGMASATNQPTYTYNCIGCLFKGNYYCPASSYLNAGNCDSSSFFTCPSQLQGSLSQCLTDLPFIDLSSSKYSGGNVLTIINNL